MSQLYASAGSFPPGDVTRGEAIKNATFGERLRFALGGLAAAWRHESSFRTQLTLGVAATVVMAVARPPTIWWALFALSVAAVLAAELINTALEHLADRVHPEDHAAIRIAKDCAAAAVLCASAGAAIIGGLAVLVGFGVL